MDSTPKNGDFTKYIENLNSRRNTNTQADSILNDSTAPTARVPVRAQDRPTGFANPSESNNKVQLPPINTPTTVAPANPPLNMAQAGKIRLMGTAMIAAGVMLLFGFIVIFLYGEYSNILFSYPVLGAYLIVQGSKRLKQADARGKK